MGYISGKGSKSDRNRKKEKPNKLNIYNNKHVRKFELIMEKNNNNNNLNETEYKKKNKSQNKKEK
jgi:hypothetical protein